MSRLYRPTLQDVTGASDRQYRRGAIMGLTMAEAFILIAFILLLLLGAWKTQSDAERARLQDVSGMTSEELALVSLLVNSGQLDLAAKAAELQLEPDELDLVAELSAEGDLETAARLAKAEISEGESDLILEMAAAGELGLAAKLIELGLSEEEAAEAKILSEAGQLVAAAELAAEGMDFTASQGLPDPADRWRLIDRDELRRLLDEAAELPPDLQRDLADLVEIEDPQRLADILSRARRAPEDAAVEERLAAIGERLSAAAEAEAALVESLRQTLGQTVAEIGGHIAADGSIVLPETVVFEVGRADIKPEMQRFLAAACEPWLHAMMRSPAPVAGAQIEGHASSEWRRETSADRAYLNNLDLSQRRSQAVLRTCLDVVQSDELRRWAYRHLAAVGYSSARPVIRNGEEDRDLSRRVVFSIEVDDADLLRDVERNVQGDLPPETAAAGVLSGQVTHVRDGDTIEVSGQAVRLKGLTCDELGTPLGDRAADAVRERVLGTAVACALSGETSYDRVIGTCSLPDGSDLSASLIENGLCGRCSAYDTGNLYASIEGVDEWAGATPGYCE